MGGQRVSGGLSQGLLSPVCIEAKTHRTPFQRGRRGTPQGGKHPYDKKWGISLHLYSHGLD